MGQSGNKEYPLHRGPKQHQRGACEERDHFGGALNFFGGFQQKSTALTVPAAWWEERAEPQLVRAHGLLRQPELASCCQTGLSMRRRWGKEELVGVGRGGRGGPVSKCAATPPRRSLSFSLLHPENSFQFILLHVLVMAWVVGTLKYFIYTWNWIFLIFFFLWNIAMETSSLCWKINDWKCSLVTNLLQDVIISAHTKLCF